MHELENEIRRMRNEIPADLLERFSHEGILTTSYDVCEHSTTQSNLQCCNMPTFLIRGRGEGGAPKKGILGEYLQEYEYQPERFREHLSFL